MSTESTYDHINHKFLIYVDHFYVGKRTFVVESTYPDSGSDPKEITASG